MQFKKKVTIETSDFWYDLFQGGYIKPENLLKNPEDVKRVQDAIKTLRDFYDSAEENEVIEFI